MMEASMKTRKCLFTVISLSFASLVTVFAASQRGALAEGYPSHAVKLVVPYPPGGPGDALGRIVAQKLSEGGSGPFYVVNMPGAGGTIGGAAAAANAPPDGYTVLLANQDLVIQPIIKTKVPYDPFKSFVPVSQIVAAPEMIVVHPSLPVGNMKELIALLRANPGKYSYATPGYGTSPHLACEWLFRLTYGLDVTHVPFQGAAPAVMSTLSGQTPIFHNMLPTVAPYIKEGKLRPLAVASLKRSPVFPDVPTLEEALLPGHEVGFWMGALVPADTPAGIVQWLQSRIATMVTLPDVKERLATIGFEPASDTSQAFAHHIKAEYELWGKIVRDAHLKFD
jgi:tripartite-type tricarboxylate transporter receptor subunit TctC